MGTMRATVLTEWQRFMRMIQNLVLTKLGQMALILLNYKYSPTGRIGVNVSIRPHSTLPHNGRIPRKKKVYKIPKLQWSGIGVLRLCRYGSGVHSTPMSSLSD